jgi:hypothetical protein
VYDAGTNTFHIHMHVSEISQWWGSVFADKRILNWKLYLKNTNKDYVQNYEQKKKWPTRSQNNQIVSYNTMVLQWRIFQKKSQLI